MSNAQLVTNLRQFQEQVAAFASQVTLEAGSTALGDSHEWRMARLAEMDKLADTLRKIDILASAIEKTDSGPFEYVSVGVT